VTGLRKMRHRGLPKVGWQFTLAMAAPLAEQIGATHAIGPTEQATDLHGCPALTAIRAGRTSRLISRFSAAC
jgi:hypothetical protein